MILTKEEILKLSKTDKEALIANKAAELKFTDSLSCKVGTPQKESQSKASSLKPSAPGTLDVTIVCNSAWFLDSQLDVLTSASYSKSIATKGTNIPHIADHRQSSIAHVGDVTKVYTKEIPLKELGLDSEGSTTSLIMESTVREDYNDDVYKFYKNGKINQHSIGLRYVDIKLAVNSKHENDKEEFAVWEEGYPNIINKELADKHGYFWLVKEVNVIENSCVLFGANSLTPTLAVKSDTVTKATKLTNSTIKGNNTMTLEDALVANAALTAEVATLKAEVRLAEAKGKSDEQTRVLGILNASTVHKMPAASAIKRITANSTVDDSISMFEEIAEATQVKLDTTLQPSTINEETVPKGEDTFSSLLDAALKQPTEQLFKGLN